MNKFRIIVCLALMVLVLASCSKKKESRTIITTIEEPQISDETKVVGDTCISTVFEWSGTSYTAEVCRKAERAAATVKDDDGQKYYDNSISLALNGPDGNIFRRTFTKGDFDSYIDKQYIKPSRSTLMSIVFSKIDGGNAVFMATIGSPCTMDDEFMLVEIDLSKAGGMSMKAVSENEEQE